MINVHARRKMRSDPHSCNENKQKTKRKKKKEKRRRIFRLYKGFSLLAFLKVNRVFKTSYQLQVTTHNPKLA